ncbi:hypothetical protein PCLA_03f0493 [Pseudomonas citronellolis]|nr:hypothetical protein PCLA_03f0493 [Pseudomonas citronellolis]
MEESRSCYCSHETLQCRGWKTAGTSYVERRGRISARKYEWRVGRRYESCCGAGFSGVQQCDEWSFIHWFGGAWESSEGIPRGNARTGPGPGAFAGQKGARGRSDQMR